MPTSQKVQIDTYDFGASLTNPTLGALTTGTTITNGTANSCNEQTADSGVYIADFVGADASALIPAGTYRLRTTVNGKPLKRFVTFTGVDGELVYARSERAAVLDPTARVKLDASQPDYAPATVAAVAAAKAILDKIDTGLVQDGLVYQFTANMLELAPAATGVDELITLQNQILDAVNTYISNVTAAAILTPGTIVGFPETLTVGDSYTDDCDSAIQVFIRDENNDPITAVGTHDFTDGDFAPECIITQNGNTGRVNCTVTYVTASPENYLKIQIPSKESRRATPGIATVQVLLKWDGAQKALSKQTVTWEALI